MDDIISLINGVVSVRVTQASTSRYIPHLGRVALEEPVAHEEGGALVPQRPSTVVGDVVLVNFPPVKRGCGALARVDCSAFTADFVSVL